MTRTLAVGDWCFESGLGSSTMMSPARGILNHDPRQMKTQKRMIPDLGAFCLSVVTTFSCHRRVLSGNDIDDDTKDPRTAASGG